MGFHSQSWQSLRDQMDKNSTIFGMKPILTLVVASAFARNGSCSDNLKIKPIYRFLAHYIHSHYGFERQGICLKSKKGFFNNAATFLYFASLYGKINMLIGIARSEEKRINNEIACSWGQKSIVKVYPLIDIGYDRKDCQNYIASLSQPVPLPSNCILCPSRE